MMTKHTKRNTTLTWQQLQGLLDRLHLEILDFLEHQQQIAEESKASPWTTWTWENTIASLQALALITRHPLLQLKKRVEKENEEERRKTKTKTKRTITKRKHKQAKTSSEPAPPLTIFVTFAKHIPTETKKLWEENAFYIKCLSRARSSLHNKEEENPFCSIWQIISVVCSCFVLSDDVCEIKTHASTLLLMPLFVHSVRGCRSFTWMSHVWRCGANYPWSLQVCTTLYSFLKVAVRRTDALVNLTSSFLVDLRTWIWMSVICPCFVVQIWLI